MAGEETKLYIVGWGGEYKVMAATSMDALWERIKKNYFKGCVVTIEDAETRKIYKK